ncbi:UDP-4-amino-4,6-dideoxy-N-acetyl-beta-L-altrosamine N-acetyltransferase [Ideonella alba]|uniref:UDP-4-amino-4, 6-dideoxy-N-acetyl-beta-L-altrosamine N-acetyltransferase n=1 Tax=Ideonella alba TaxID=2824118 RepID=A0A940Y4J3_9BURK|nr:UDP-4-amino-4,6-dideoxy-N-acetyl-beta-L-altrosamine N-acetyltransferase [Ideonella alba]MBQ0929647.1 UDP-4-amino-4,6-dideoxy-N-acetyl-beta-L-altrosamine N-acetyltransferase [Ideonella alba]
MSTERLRPLRAEDLPLVRAWRNHPAVRQHMFTTHEITADEHAQWFQRQQADATRRLYLFERDGVPQGFMHLSGVQPGGVCEWGFYAAPDAPRGTGRAMGAATLAELFEVEQVHKIRGQVLQGNQASLRFHEALGFQPEGVLPQPYVGADGQRQDVHCYGLQAEAWRATRAG